MVLVVLCEFFLCDKKKNVIVVGIFIGYLVLVKYCFFMELEYVLSQFYFMDCKFLIWCLVFKEFFGFFLEMFV